MNANNATVTGLQNGSYTFRWTTSNGICPVSTSTVNITAEDCRIQVAKTASTPQLNTDGSYTVTFQFAVTNPSSTIALNGVQVTDNLNTAFPSPRTFAVTSVSATGALSGAVNAGFNGNTDQNLLTAAASLPAGATSTITLVVKVNLN